MNTSSSTFARLFHTAERYRAKLAQQWASDPTVLAGFDADFKALLDRLEQGDIPHKFARNQLKLIYEALLPIDNAGRVCNLSNPLARAVPGHGQFYKVVRSGVWAAIDYWESRAYQEATPNRSIWLTYTKGARQAL